MKKRFLYYTMLFTALLACSDDFTEIEPIGALADEALANETGVDLLLTGAYSALDGIRNNQNAPDWTVTGDNWWFDVISDDAHKGSTDGDQPTYMPWRFLIGQRPTSISLENGTGCMPV